jgi:uncharacterized protein YjbI with pentapeptide repeats
MDTPLPSDPSPPFKHNLSDELETFGSSTIFNRSRKPIQTDERAVSFLNVSLRDRNLSKHQLSNSRFTNCHFFKVVFGRLEKVEFAGCSFFECRFSETSSQGSGAFDAAASLENVLFYACKFEQTNFINCRIQNIQIGRSSFVTPPQFHGARLRGYLQIKDSGNWKAFSHLPDLDTQLSWNNSIKTDLEVVRPFGLSWEKIRAIQEIPFLQVSLVGFILLVVQITILNALLYVIQEPELICRKIMEHTEGVDFDRFKLLLAGFCDRIGGSAVIQSIRVSVGQAVLLFSVLFFAALVHKIKCPSEVREYTSNQWRIDHRKPGIFYEILAMRDFGYLVAAIVLYVVALGLFSVLAVGRIVSIVRSGL